MEKQEVLVEEMTLRDYFAGQALAALIGRGNAVLYCNEIHSIAYAYSDKMLEERKKYGEADKG